MYKNTISLFKVVYETQYLENKLKKRVATRATLGVYIHCEVNIIYVFPTYRE